MLNAVLNNPEMQDFLIGYPDNQYTLKYLKTQSDESEETTLTEAETVQETTAQDSNEEKVHILYLFSGMKDGLISLMVMKISVWQAAVPHVCQWLL